MALKLFCLRNGKGGAMVLGADKQPMYFGSKPEAKKARQEGHVVSYGIDHKLYKGNQ
jgi:hypothetical protein